MLGGGGECRFFQRRVPCVPPVYLATSLSCVAAASGVGKVPRLPSHATLTFSIISQSPPNHISRRPPADPRRRRAREARPEDNGPPRYPVRDAPAEGRGHAVRVPGGVRDGGGGTGQGGGRGGEAGRGRVLLAGAPFFSACPTPTHPYPTPTPPLPSVPPAIIGPLPRYFPDRSAIANTRLLFSFPVFFRRTKPSGFGFPSDAYPRPSSIRGQTAKQTTQDMDRRAATVSQGTASSGLTGTSRPPTSQQQQRAPVGGGLAGAAAAAVRGQSEPSGRGGAGAGGVGGGGGGGGAGGLGATMRAGVR